MPPVTELRSPPLSRMTGALSPVIALSFTEATPSMTSPSAGMKSPASTSTTSPLRSADAATQLVVLAPRSGRRRRLAWSSRRALRSDAAWALPRPSAIASAKLANSTVNQSHTDTQKMNQAGRLAPADERLEPQQRRQDGAHVDDEHDRVPHLAPGRQLAERVDDRLADDRRIEERAGLGRAAMGLRTSLAGDQDEVLDDRPERQRRHEGQGADQDDHADQEADEQRRVRRQRAGPGGTVFFRASAPAMASTGTASQ